MLLLDEKFQPAGQVSWGAEALASEHDGFWIRHGPGAAAGDERDVTAGWSALLSGPADSLRVWIRVMTGCFPKRSWRWPR